MCDGNVAYGSSFIAVGEWMSKVILLMSDFGEADGSGEKH
mgnify:CR=1 FL=1